MDKENLHSSPRGPWIVTVLALLSIFPPLSTDMYLSAFSDIQVYLKASDGVLELSLSVFFLGLCIGQLLFGVIIDRVGRKTPLLVGAGVFCVTTLLLLFTTSANVFVALRFVQALGACAGMVVGRAVVTDLYSGQAAARTMTFLAMLMTLGPIVSPFLGGLLVTAFGWKSVFVAMLLIGLTALLLASAILPETLPKAARLTSPVMSVFRDYAKLLNARGFIVPAVVSAFIQAVMFSFITASSSVFQGVFGLNKITYGLAFGFVALGLAVASWGNHRLLAFWDVKTVVNRFLPVFVVAGVLLVLVSGTRDLLVLIVPLWFAIALVGLLNANCTAIAMEASRGMAGGGSALVGMLQLGVAFVCSAIVASQISASALPLALGVLIPASIAFMIWFAARRK